MWIIFIFLIALRRFFYLLITGNWRQSLNTWQAHITGINPGVVSPSFSCGLMAKDTVIKFRVKVLGNDYSGKALMYLEDEKGSWNNEMPIGNIDMSHNYREYTVDLSFARSDLEVKKFSLELTSGGSGEDEYWTFKWLKIYSKADSWDFSDSQLGWTIVSGAAHADFYPDDVGYWRMSATGKQPRIASPYLYNISSNYTTLTLRYSVLMDKNEKGEYRKDLKDPLANAYFDLGEGIKKARIAQAPIKRDGKNHEINFTIPSDIRGKVARVYVDLFDSADYLKKFIAIDKIDFNGFDKTGQYTDGWHSDGTSQAFIDCRNKFGTCLGEPFDNKGGSYVHKVENVWAQDFKQELSKPHYGTDGESCLILNQGLKQVFVVKNGFWGKYKEIWGFKKLGAPKDNEYVDGSAKGKVVLNPDGKGYPFFKSRPVNAVLFRQSSYKANNDAIVRQNFEKGYMIWDGTSVKVYYNNNCF